MSNLNIYKCWIDKYHVGWDTYDSCVIIASNIDEARTISYNHCINEYERGIVAKYSSDSDIRNVSHKQTFDYVSAWKQCHVEKIGMADNGSISGTVVASFNAG